MQQVKKNNTRVSSLLQLSRHPSSSWRENKAAMGSPDPFYLCREQMFTGLYSPMVNFRKVRWIEDKEKPLKRIKSLKRSISEGSSWPKEIGGFLPLSLSLSIHCVPQSFPCRHSGIHILFVGIPVSPVRKIFMGQSEFLHQEPINSGHPRFKGVGLLSHRSILFDLRKEREP